MPCQVGVDNVEDEILGHWDPQTYNAGCYNPLSTLDDGHTPSPHAKGEAADIGIEPPYRGRYSVGQLIFLWLISIAARLGITQLIYDGQIWTKDRPYIRSYLTNPHRDHIHVQFDPGAARNPNLHAAPFPGQSNPAPVAVTPKGKMLMFLTQDPRKDAAGNHAVYLTDGGKSTRKMGSDDETFKYQILLRRNGLDGAIEKSFTPAMIDALLAAAV